MVKKKAAGKPIILAQKKAKRIKRKYGPNAKWTEQQIADALMRTKGRVYLAARLIGCAGRTIYEYMDRYSSLKEIRPAADAERVDIAESKLDTAVMNGEAWAIRFMLITQGKSRGYVEHPEQLPAGGPTQASENPWKELAMMLLEDKDIGLRLSEVLATSGIDATPGIAKLSKRGNGNGSG